MGQNKLVQYGAVILLVIAVLIGVKACKNDRPVSNGEVQVGGGETLSEEALAGLGVLFEAKNPTENVSTGYDTSCLPCHSPVEDSDWVYTFGYPELKQPK